MVIYLDKRRNSQGNQNRRATWLVAGAHRSSELKNERLTHNVYAHRKNKYGTMVYGNDLTNDSSANVYSYL